MIIQPKDIKPRKPGPRPKYPWDEWMDGARRELVQGRDFSCKLDTLVWLFRLNARKRGLVPHVYTYPESNHLIAWVSKPSRKKR